MPGLFGIITKRPSAQAEAELSRMATALQHEAFYRNSIWTDPNAGVYAGSVAYEGSFGDCMPLFNEKRDIVLLFSGEEFPPAGTTRQLQQCGHDCSTDGPSYLPHLYEQEPSFPANLNGRFHGLLIDRHNGTAVLFNDRYGMHRLYYYDSRDTFYFAAEAKAILAVCPEARCIDRRSLGEFVACGCVLENRSLFKGVGVLPTASKWVFRKGTLERKAVYFEPREWEDQERLSPEAYYDELKTVFSENLPRYFASSSTVAMSLTGGLDSRMIMAWQRCLPGTLACYTFGGDGSYRQCQDAVLARKVADACGQKHDIIPVGQAFLDRFSHYCERTAYLSDGCLLPNRAPDLYLNELARETAPVRITGNYGGEVLRGSRSFKPITLAPGVLSGDLTSEIDTAFRTYSRAASCHPLTFAAFRQAPWNDYNPLSLEQTQVSPRTPYLDNEFIKTLFRAPDRTDVQSVCMRLIADGNPTLARIRTDRGLCWDRNVYTRARRSLLEFLFKAEYGYDEGMPHWVARIDRVISPLRPELLFLGTHKFHHFRAWYRRQLAKYVREVLTDSATLSRPFLRRDGVERIVSAHLKGTGNYTLEIHKLLALELLHRVFIDSTATISSWPGKATLAFSASQQN